MMKTCYLIAVIGLCVTLCTPCIVSAQTTTPPKKTTPAKSVTKPKPAGETIRRSGLPPGFLDQNDQGEGFTSSSMRAMTRAGTIGVETGTFGSDSNGQIGTTNQNNMVHSTPSGIIVMHFGSAGSGKPAPPKAHRSPRPKTKDQQNP